ncbi:MAG TPA: quinone oxidoreductase [Ktedonobacterales bacterium]|nr:quinone oxidoreductase [Ktedonobacterales bacterium]
MKAIRITEPGGPEVLHLDEVPTPEPGEGQARVKLEASGVNFIDIYFRTGQYKAQLPMTIGSEAAGVVDAVGPGVTEVHVGDHVASTQFAGAYAEYAVAPARGLVRVPEGVGSRVAAAVLLQGMTAHYLTHSTFPLKRGNTALIHAAAGGVGLLLVQIAKRMGARVIGTTSTEEKGALARQAGADEVILYTQQDFEAETKRLTGGRGVDVVYDSVGKTTFDASMNCLRPRGYLVLFGQSSGAVAPVDPQTLNSKGSLFLTRPTLAHYIASRDEMEWRASDIFSWIAAGELSVRIGRESPLAQAGAAQEALTGRQTTGKVLLIP